MGSYGGVASLKGMLAHGQESKLIVYGFMDQHLWRNIALALLPMDHFVFTRRQFEKTPKARFFIEDEVPTKQHRCKPTVL
jgi:hypothetical protein